MLSCHHINKAAINKFLHLKKFTGDIKEIDVNIGLCITSHFYINILMMQVFPHEFKRALKEIEEERAAELKANGAATQNDITDVQMNGVNGENPGYGEGLINNIDDEEEKVLTLV